MDNVCHTLVGAAFGEAGLKRRTRFGAAALMISANIPDVDVAVFFTDTSPVSFRRGITHGIVAQLLLPLILTGAFVLLDKLFRRDPLGDRPPFRPSWLLILSFVGVYSHVFLDWLNNYGVRLLTPFSWRWLYGDSVFIVDPWLWLMCAAGIWLSRRQRRVGPARGALIVAACYIVVMVVSAQVARTLVERQWREARGTEPVRLMVGPVPVTPLTREVIVDAGDHYESGTFSWRSMSLTLPERIPKNDTRPEVAAARTLSPAIRAVLVWSRFPYWTLQPEGDGTRVILSDMRFPGRGGDTFSVSTIVPASASAEPSATGQ